MAQLPGDVRRNGVLDVVVARVQLLVLGGLLGEELLQGRRAHLLDAHDALIVRDPLAAALHVVRTVRLPRVDRLQQDLQIDLLGMHELAVLLFEVHLLATLPSLTQIPPCFPGSRLSASDDRGEDVSTRELLQVVIELVCEGFHEGILVDSEVDRDHILGV